MVRQRSRTRTKMFGITKKITNRITNKKKENYEKDYFNSSCRNGTDNKFR